MRKLIILTATLVGLGSSLSASEPDHARIKNVCGSLWPDSYMMRNICIDNELSHFLTLQLLLKEAKRLGMESSVAHCETIWHQDSYQLMQVCVQEEIAARAKLQN